MNLFKRMNVDYVYLGNFEVTFLYRYYACIIAICYEKFLPDQPKFASHTPAETGKSYLQQGLMELAKSKGLVVTTVAPSGVAAHLMRYNSLYIFLWILSGIAL